MKFTEFYARYQGRETSPPAHDQGSDHEESVLESTTPVSLIKVI